jgi:hypothetical protein
MITHSYRIGDRVRIVTYGYGILISQHGAVGTVINVFPLRLAESNDPQSPLVDMQVRLDGETHATYLNAHEVTRV